jgi:hypothetical protein
MDDVLPPGRPFFLKTPVPMAQAEHAGPRTVAPNDGCEVVT